MRLSITDAKNKLPELIKAVESGQSVTICRRGKPVADLVRTKTTSSGKRKLGTLKGRIVINDPDWWKPMSMSEAESFFGD